MHNLAISLPFERPTPPARSARPHLSATHVVRPAAARDIADIAELVSCFSADGLMLPRSTEQIALELDDYVVAVAEHDRLVACAALTSYSPSLAEVSSVAVASLEQGKGLGTLVVQGAEAVARRRGISELFAMTLSDGFFESLGYGKTSLARYPEKRARYRALALAGVDIVPKSCYRKVTGWR